MHKVFEINITNFNTTAGALANPTTQISEATQERQDTLTIQLETLAVSAALWFILPI